MRALLPIKDPCYIIIVSYPLSSVIPQTPTISSSPSGTLTDGGAFTLTCTTASTGLSSASYIWNVATVDQAASGTNTLTVNAVDINNVQDYKCKVSGDGGSSYSAYSNTHTPIGWFPSLLLVRTFCQNNIL